MITKFRLYESTDKEKVDFEWNGYKFKNITVYSEHSFAPMGGVSSVMRQYIKQKWNVPFQISSDTFSGGDSVNVYLSPLKIDKNLFNEMESELTKIFQKGNFNGMDDSYEYNRDAGVKYNSKNGVIIFGTKYLHVDHRPKYGTKEYDAYEKYLEREREIEKFNL